MRPGSGHQASRTAPPGSSWPSGLAWAALCPLRHRDEGCALSGGTAGAWHQETGLLATSNLSTLPPQWPVRPAPTSVEILASVCRAHRGPTRAGTASSAAHRAPAATGSAWPVPAMCPNVEVSWAQPGRGGRPGPGTSCLH